MTWDLGIAMRDGVEKSQMVIACINQYYQNSGNCMKELNAAFDRNKPMLFVPLDAEPHVWANARLKEICDFGNKKYVDLSEVTCRSLSINVYYTKPSIALCLLSGA